MSRNKKRTKKTSVKTRKKSTAKLLSKKEKLWLVILLVVTFLAYSPLLQSEFINYDDDFYITENPLVRNLSIENIGEIFSTFYGNQYAPVAMSLMALQIKLFGLNAGILKFISILFHLVNTLLVFYFLRFLFSKYSIAFLSALIFALHPIQVEAIGWLAASMKISTFSFFFLSSIILYLKYRKHKKRNFYWYSICLFALSCMSKEQAIVLPLVLVLIDYYRGREWKSRIVLLEKAPYFLIAVIFGIVTLVTSGSQQGAQMLDYFNPFHRILFACWTILSYILKFIFPIQLSTFYTYPLKTDIPLYFYGAPLLTLGILWVLFRAWKKDNRLLVFATLFFLINLSLTLVAQIMSVRDVMMADRYMYISTIGLGVILSYGIATLSKKTKFLYSNTVLMPVLIGVLLLPATYNRSKVWENSITVFTDAIEKGALDIQTNPFLALPYNNRGIAFKRIGNLEAAMQDYNLAIEANDQDGKHFLNRGNLYFETGKPDLAQTDYNRALQIDSTNAKLHSSQGALYASLEKYDLALASINEALRLDPLLKDALSNRIKIYYFTNQRDLALREIESYLRLYPGDASVIEVRNALLNNSR